MATVDVDAIAAYRRISGPIGWSKGRRPHGSVLHSSNEPGEFPQWLAMMIAA